MGCFAMRILDLEISQEECLRFGEEAGRRALLTKDDPGECTYWTYLSNKWVRMAELAAARSPLTLQGQLRCAPEEKRDDPILLRSS